MKYLEQIKKIEMALSNLYKELTVREKPKDKTYRRFIFEVRKLDDDVRGRF
jgi:predicted SprT family Zn-dependent metalloprotease